jgi:hypothetical protein
MGDFIANTTATFLGGTGTNRFGDEVDVPMIKAEGVPVSILESGPISKSRPADGRTDQVRGYTLRVRPGRVDLDKYDRVIDERTGRTFTFDLVTTPEGNVGPKPISVQLRLVT